MALVALWLRRLPVGIVAEAIAHHTILCHLDQTTHDIVAIAAGVVDTNHTLTLGDNAPQLVALITGIKD